MFDRRSKYEPFHVYLLQQRRSEVPLSFRDVEEILGFVLPPSARRHPAWWSNNRGTNVAVKAWRDAGWRTSRVDLSKEKVVFVRDGGEELDPPRRQVGSNIVIERPRLTPAAIRLLEDYGEEKHCELAEAMIGVINMLALERRRQLVDWFRANSPLVPGDSSELIREDRDAR